MSVLSLALFVLATIGVVCLAIQAGFLRRFLAAPLRKPTQPMPPISILKPLTGLDDALQQNLQSFAALDHPDYEVVLGVHSLEDPVVPLARQMVEKWPQRFRLVVQDGSPGLNPKVNQLVTLAKAARHDVLLVSDASVRVSDGYLPEIAAHLEDPQTGMVTHIFAGEGEQSLGSLLDNFHLMSHYGGGAIAARDAGGQTLVNGKSTAIRRADLDAMGGFEALCDYAAEDFILGLWVGRKINKKVCFARYTPITMSVNRTIPEYIKRYERWSIMQRTGGGYLVYLSQTMVYPLILTTLGLLLHPTIQNGIWWLGIGYVKAILDYIQASMLRYTRISPLTILIGPLNDLLIAWVWTYGLLFNKAIWRGTELRVTWKTKLVPVQPK